MRRAPVCAVFLLLAASAAAPAQDVSARLSKYFTAWYSVCPNTKVTVSKVPEIAIAGYESYRVERQCDHAVHHLDDTEAAQLPPQIDARRRRRAWEAVDKHDPLGARHASTVLQPRLHIKAFRSSVAAR